MHHYCFFALPLLVTLTFSALAGVVAFAGDALRFTAGFAGDGDAAFAGVATFATDLLRAFFAFTLAVADTGMAGARVGLLTIMYSTTTTRRTERHTEANGLLTECARVCVVCEVEGERKVNVRARAPMPHAGVLTFVLLRRGR